MRDVSFQRALESKSGSTNEIWHSPKIVSVKQCNFADIIMKKLQLARREIRRKINIYRDNQKPEYNVYSWITDEVILKISSEYLAFISLPFIEDGANVVKKIKYYPEMEKGNYSANY